MTRILPPGSEARRDPIAAPRPSLSGDRRVLAAAILAAILGSAAPAWAGAYLRVSEVAQRYGLTPEMDLLTGRCVLSDGRGNQVALLPGGFQLLVNGRYAELPERVGTDGGDLIVPASALAFIEKHLVRAAPPPVVAAAPKPVATTVPAKAPSDARPAAAVVPGSAGTVVLDPGHGGVHTGARGRTGLLEKDVNLAVARHAKALLEARGWKVVLTRSDDRHFNPEINADLDARISVAARVQADLFVSIHTNYAESTSARGFEVYSPFSRPRDAELARAISRSFKATIDDEDRGVKNAGFRVIKRAKIPAVLVEVGFVSHPPTERRLATDDYRRKLAEAIVRGIDAYGRSARSR